MLLQSTLSLALAIFSTVAVSAPVEALQMGSKHNLYLVTCTKRARESDCPLIILCGTEQVSYTAVAYYANGPIEANRNTDPTQISTVSQPVQPWEGTPRTAKINRVGDFSSNIDSAAAGIANGQIAGSAKLSEEEFVCFKDGETSFTVRNDLGIQQYSCSADYWCPSIQI